MSEPSVPTLLAMLVCDQVIIDQQTKKKSLIGVFDNINAIVFPAATNCAVYAKLADAEGQYKFKVRVVNLKDEQLLGEMEVGATVQTQTEPVDMAIYLMGIAFPTPGKYEVQLYANEVYLGRVTMRAIQLNVPGIPGVSPWQQH